MSKLRQIPKGPMRGEELHQGETIDDSIFHRSPELRVEETRSRWLRGEISPNWEELRPKLAPPLSTEEFQAARKHFPIVGTLDEIRRLQRVGLYAGYDFDLVARRFYLLGGTSYSINPDGTDLKYNSAFTIREIQDKWVVDTLDDKPVHEEFAQMPEAVDAVIAWYQVAGAITTK